MKNIRVFYPKNFHCFGVKMFSIFEQACFRNGRSSAVFCNIYDPGLHRLVPVSSDKFFFS